MQRANSLGVLTFAPGQEPDAEPDHEPDPEPRAAAEPDTCGQPASEAASDADREPDCEPGCYGARGRWCPCGNSPPCEVPRAVLVHAGSKESHGMLSGLKLVPGRCFAGPGRVGGG